MMPNTPLKINQSYHYIVGMGVLCFILTLEALLLGWLARTLKRVWLQDCITLHLGYGANKGHAMNEV
ncbi:hypothetical protein JP0557_05480 [Helicobacter pylori]